MRAKAKQSIAVVVIAIVLCHLRKFMFFCCCRHCERKRSNPLSKITIDCHEKIKNFFSQWQKMSSLSLLIVFIFFVIPESLYFIVIPECLYRESIKIYYSSVIPAKQLSGNLSNNKHPFFCRCRHCEQSEAIHYQR